MILLTHFQLASVIIIQTPAPIAALFSWRLNYKHRRQALADAIELVKNIDKKNVVQINSKVSR